MSGMLSQGVRRGKGDEWVPEAVALVEATSVASFYDKATVTVGRLSAYEFFYSAIWFDGNGR